MGDIVEHTAGEPFPLITVVIATYNYGRYICQAIDSVLTQDYPNVELIVIDDGSTDETRRMVEQYDAVEYYYHTNRGVSASRNIGINKASGHYIVFLDADDWLEPAALMTNYNFIKHSPELAFVSGNYYLINAETGNRSAVMVDIAESHYCALLKSNYIGMLAAVLFQTSVLKEIPFDEKVLACEDYDLFLNIARRYPVAHHQSFIATYFLHASGLSHEYALMMDSIRSVIGKQKERLRSPEEWLAYEEGITQWKAYETLLSASK